MTRVLFLFVSFVLYSCHHSQQKKASTSEPSKRIQSVYVPDLVDSIDILYFKKPFVDSLRYQRFYTYIRTGDTSLIGALRENLQLGFQEYLNPIECLSEGKVIIPHGGDAFRIVYFSRLQTPCAYVYIIDNGRFRYYPISVNVKRLLDNWEVKAVEPR